ncbi:MAG: hypothetical protein ACR2JB_06735 [Bryobacteraceae bacterium]
MRFFRCGILAVVCIRLIAAASSDFEKLDLQDGSAIAIDPVTDVGWATLTLTNHSGKSSRVSVRAGQVMSASTGLPLAGAKLLFRAAGAPEEARPAETKYEVNDELAPGQSNTLTAAISGIEGGGSYSIALFNGSQPIGKLSATGFPFRVHPDTAANGTVQVTVAADRSYFMLKNDDPLEYPIFWELFVGTRKASGSLELRPSASEEVEINESGCGGSGSGAPSCLLSVSGGWARFSSWLKDSSEDGRLRIAYRPKTGTESTNVQREASLVPHLVIPVKVVTHYRASDETAILSSVILFVFLALGALLSVFANLWIPHNLRRNAISSRLKLLIRNIREISAAIPSQARISAEVDARELLDRLKNAGWFYSDFDTVLLEYDAQVSVLEARFALLQQADEYRQDLEQLSDIDIPPTYIARARRAFEPAMEVFEGSQWTSTQQKLASEFVEAFKQQVDALRNVRSGVDEQFKSEIATRLARLKSVFGQTRQDMAASFEKFVPSIFKRLNDGTLDGKLGLSDYVQLDFDLWKLWLVERFVHAYEGATSASWRKKLETRAGLSDEVPSGSLLYFLQLNTWDAVECAKLLCDEVDQGIFPEDICAALSHLPRQVAIRVRQNEIMSNRRVDFELCFSNYAMNSAMARREIMPVWTFSVPGHTDTAPHEVDPHGATRTMGATGDLMNRLRGKSSQRHPGSKSERGWVVSCFVPQLAEIHVKVSFENWFGEMQVGADQADLEKSFPIQATDDSLVWARFWLEISRSCVALAIPVVGLLAGARDKLLGMDVTTAIAAVFVLGFSTDSIKSALLRGTSAAPTQPSTTAVSSQAAPTPAATLPGTAGPPAKAAAATSGK